MDTTAPYGWDINTINYLTHNLWLWIEKEQAFVGFDQQKF